MKKKNNPDKCSKCKKKDKTSQEKDGEQQTNKNSKSKPKSKSAKHKIKKLAKNANLFGFIAVANTERLCFKIPTFFYFRIRFTTSSMTWVDLAIYFTFNHHEHSTNLQPKKGPSKKINHTRAFDLAFSAQI